MNEDDDPIETPRRRSLKEASEKIRTSRKNLFNVAAASSKRHNIKTRIPSLPHFSIQDKPEK